MSVVGRIYLSKTGKHAGKYTAIVSAQDIDLLKYNWFVSTKRSQRVMYAFRTDNSKMIMLHHIIIKRMIGRKLKSGEQVDHINGDGLDNRRENLRLATATQNNRNRRKPISNSSGYKGVSWIKDRQKWRAKISVDGKQINLGYFDNPKDAHKAYCDAADKYFGEFANYD